MGRGGGAYCSSATLQYHTSQPAPNDGFILSLPYSEVYVSWFLYKYKRMRMPFGCREDIFYTSDILSYRPKSVVI